MEGNFRESDERYNNSQRRGSYIPGRSARTDKRNLRAYNFQMDGLPWGEQRHYEERPQNQRGRQSQRSAAWRGKAKNNSAPTQSEERKTEVKTAMDYAAKTETKPIDEPMYNCSGFGASIAIREEYCQNFDFSGFPQLIDRTYEQLRSLDERLSRTMPRCMFNHSMTVLANAVLLDRDQENGHRPLDQNDYAEDALPSSFNVPGPIHDYLRCVANTATIDGDAVKINLPDIAIPEGPLDDIHSGTYGPIGIDHNKYECYPSPYVTMQRLIASRDNQQNWQPLPDGFFPEGALPNENLIGYGPIDHLTPEGRERLQGLDFRNDDTILGRICYSSELMLRVSTKLETLKDKFEMLSLEDSKLMRKRIPERVSLTNVTFVESPITNRPLNSIADVVPNILSHAQFGSNQSAQAALQCLHRRRSVYNAGICYLIDGNPPPGWLNSRNYNFEMREVFAPTNNMSDLPTLRHERFLLPGTIGSRPTILQDFIRKNFVKKKTT